MLILQPRLIWWRDYLIMPSRLMMMLPDNANSPTTTHLMTWLPDNATWSKCGWSDDQMKRSFILFTSWSQATKNITQVNNTQQCCLLGVMDSTLATNDVCGRRRSAKTARMRAQPYPSVNRKEQLDRTNQFITDHQELINSKKISFYGAMFTSHNSSYQLADMLNDIQLFNERKDNDYDGCGHIQLITSYTPITFKSRFLPPIYRGSRKKPHTMLLLQLQCGHTCSQVCGQLHLSLSSDFYEPNCRNIIPVDEECKKNIIFLAEAPTRLMWSLSPRRRMKATIASRRSKILQNSYVL